MARALRELPIRGAQIRAARALLDWSATRLAQESGLARMTIQRYERHQGVPPFAKERLATLRRTLESAGITFLGDPEKNPGVRLSGARMTPPK